MVSARIGTNLPERKQVLNSPGARRASSDGLSGASAVSIEREGCWRLLCIANRTQRGVTYWIRDTEGGGQKRTKDGIVHPRVERAMQKIGTDFFQARRVRRIAAEDFAQHVGISRATLHRLENGDPGIALNTVAMALAGSRPSGRACEHRGSRMRCPRSFPALPSAGL